MKKRLYTGMTIISTIVIIVTMVVTVGIFYNQFSRQVLEDLKTHVHILKTTEAVLEYVEKDFDPRIDNLRITVIDSEGNVKYDSNADIGSMGNHGNRPEVHDAMKNGSGQAIRKSDTLDKNTYYYAEMLDDGEVIRVAKEAGNIWQFGIRILPALVAELFFAVAVCIIAARYFARKLIEPVEQLAGNLDNDVQMKTYKEIQPFLDKIHSQHKDLKKSTKIRQEFTANVSHELKTPLASISGYAELIETGMAKEEDVRRFAGEIHKSSIRLLSLINDIIELSELDVMDGQKESTLVSLAAEVVNCVEMLQMNAEKHGVTISCNKADEECMIEANQEMIQEVIYNLCDNAIRYNQEGGHVEASVFRKGDKIVLQVKDDGIGIPKKDQERIFERFYRVDKARSKKTGGTGLGLAIVKHIVEQHGAEIKLVSNVGEGTCISVIFPAR